MYATWNGAGFFSHLRLRELQKSIIGSRASKSRAKRALVLELLSTTNESIYRHKRSRIHGHPMQQSTVSTLNFARKWKKPLIASCSKIVMFCTRSRDREKHKKNLVNRLSVAPSNPRQTIFVSSFVHVQNNVNAWNHTREKARCATPASFLCGLMKFYYLLWSTRGPHQTRVKSLWVVSLLDRGGGDITRTWVCRRAEYPPHIFRSTSVSCTKDFKNVFTPLAPSFFLG